MRVETFNVAEPMGFVARNEALRAFVAAIYDVARARHEFTTDDIFPAVRSFVSAEELRRATANSKLIAVALRKAQAKGMCQPAEGLAAKGSRTCHGRYKRVWQSNICASA